MNQHALKHLTAIRDARAEIVRARQRLFDHASTLRVGMQITEPDLFGTVIALQEAKIDLANAEIDLAERT